MKKDFTLLQLFSVVDGRLSTEIGDVYAILNHVCDSNLYTHHLPVAMQYVESKKPAWYVDVLQRINGFKQGFGSDDFKLLTDHIREWHNSTYEVPQLKDETDTSDFEKYMLDNSLLLR